MNSCDLCHRRPRAKHFNSKYCRPCRIERRRRPRSTLTTAQVRLAEGLIGKMPAPEIAQKLGTSVSNLKRAFRGKSIWFHNGKYKNQPALVRRVMAHYERHGMVATAKAFPQVRVRSIVERANYYGLTLRPRQVRWTPDQLAELARMAGIVSVPAQARYFNRPNANEGSIKSVWMKRFGLGGGSVHGMSEFAARHLVRKGTPCLKTAFWMTRRENQTFGRKLYLWVDMERNLRREIPPYLRDAVVQMAKFQRWLFQSENPKREIRRMIREREVESV
jgi:hypothetical protein